ncbi:hypothetical protein IGI37_003431 [Enterococcus sp. AZ194]|uniref:ABC transporter transmembrane domain-containing protein n=1 Tax=Enterococcus sp. AZ194 TaxID=2774629 RepID=UPI003F253EF4
MNKIIFIYIRESSQKIYKLLVLPCVTEFFFSSLIFLYSFVVDGVIRGEAVRWLLISVIYLIGFMGSYYFTIAYSYEYKADFENYLRKNVVEALVQMQEPEFEKLAEGMATEIFRNASSLAHSLVTVPSKYFKLLKIAILLMGIGYLLGWQVLLVNFILVAITFFVKNFSKKVVPYNIAVVETEEVLNEDFEQAVEGIELIKNYHLEGHLMSRFNAHLHNNLQRLVRKKLVESTLSMFFRYFNVVVGSISLLATSFLSTDVQLGMLITSTMTSSYLAQAIGEYVQVNQETENLLSIYEKYR